MMNKEDEFEVMEVALAGIWDRSDSKGFSVAWSTKAAGFGELTFLVRDGQLQIDTECMGPDFCKEVLTKLVDAATVVG